MVSRVCRDEGVWSKGAWCGVGLLALALLAGCAANRAEVEAGGNLPPTDLDRRQIEITVTEDGFHPGQITVARGEPVRLVFTRTAKKSCLEEVVVYASESQEIRRPLPLGKPVAVDVTFSLSGQLGYSCGMRMYGGAIFIR